MSNENEPGNQFDIEMRKVIEFIRLERIEVGADVLGSALIDAGVYEKSELCRNGPQDIMPLMVYFGPKAMGLAKIMSITGDMANLDTAVGETMKTLRNVLEGPPTIVSLISDTIWSRTDPSSEGYTTLEDMEAKGGDVGHALTVTTVHPYEGDVRVVTLVLPYHFADGEVQFSPEGFGSDSMMEESGDIREYDQEIIQVMVNFIKENPIEQSTTD